MRDERLPCVYILANHRHGTLYVGVTSNLYERMCAHRNGSLEGFTKTYNVKQLMWLEELPDMNAAIRREKAIKEWKRDWKIVLIEKSNPTWRDLFEETFGIDASDPNVWRVTERR
jgi:putative endonuclease